jgi:hypothetical protein
MKIVQILKTLVLVCVLFLWMPGIALGNDPDEITSSFTYWPPVIDGVVAWGEWDISNWIEFDHGFITVLNDWTRLYILVDVLEDTSDDPRSPASSRDYFWLTFDTDEDGDITPADLSYRLDVGTYNMTYWHYQAPGLLSPFRRDVIYRVIDPDYREYFRSSVAAGFGCFYGDRTQVWFEELLCLNHRVWEFGIDLDEIDAEAGELVRMGLRIVSETPSFTEDVPPNFHTDFSDLIEVRLAAEAMGPTAGPSASVWFDETDERDAIEVTQAIQTRANDMPLVAGKTTVARMYVQRTRDTGQFVIVYLHGTRDGNSLPGSPLSKLFWAPTTTIRRGVLYDTANFLLPDSWVEGTVEFHGRVFDLSGRRQDTSTFFSLTFTPKDIPVYWVIPVEINVEGRADPIVVSDEEIARPQTYLETVYPVPDVEFVRRDWSEVGATITSRVDPYAELTEEEESYWNGEVVNGIIDALQEYYAWLEQSSEQPPDQIIGIVPLMGNSDPVWNGGRGHVIAIDTREFGMAHEINHNLDRRPQEEATWGLHVTDPRVDNNRDWGCGAGGADPEWPWHSDRIQEVGFDTRDPWVDGYEELHLPVSHRFTVLPGEPLRAGSSSRLIGFVDFMSYCESYLYDPVRDIYPRVLPKRWISTYRWERLFDFFTLGPRPMPFRARPLVYYMSGHINVDGTARLNPVFVQPGIPTKDIAPGDYTIEVQDSYGKTILTTPFLASFIDVEGNEVETAYFHFQLPEQEGTSRILLKKGERILDMLEVSKNPPQVTVIAPKEGEQWSDLQTIEWSAKDEDGDPLHFDIFYSPDKGESWRPVAWNLQGEAYKVDTSFLPGGKAAKIRVIATDGFNTTEAVSSGTFMVKGKAPKGFIIQPEAETQFSPGEPISLKGEATDLEDGPIPDASFIWSYDSTVFGTGRRVNARLPEGVHEITLTVFDSEGNTGQDTVVISVRIPDREGEE